MSRAPARTYVKRGAACLFVVACACGPTPTSEQWVYTESFETSCGGAACNWQQVGGTDGDVSWETTFHPGDHAIALHGDSATAQTVLTTPGGTITSEPLTAYVVGRCDPTSTLSISVTLGYFSAGGEPTFVDEVEGTVPLPPEWSEGGPDVVLRPGSGFVDAGIEAGPGSTVIGVTISKRGMGVCEVSEIRVSDGTPYFATGGGCSCGSDAGGAA